MVSIIILLILICLLIALALYAQATERVSDYCSVLIDLDSYQSVIKYTENSEQLVRLIGRYMLASGLWLALAAAIFMAAVIS